MLQLSEGLRLDLPYPLTRYGKLLSNLFQRVRFGLTRLAAIVSADNARSIRLLEDLGFVYETLARMPTEDLEIPLYRSGRFQPSVERFPHTELPQEHRIRT